MEPRLVSKEEGVLEFQGPRHAEDVSTPLGEAGRLGQKHGFLLPWNAMLVFPIWT